MIQRDTRNYLIHRVRLINFHNFVDETIELRNGGHLFLLGDNASGKTTVLDAIHYALTAGREMELNSAARVAGARAEGRRMQGVILRYNVGAGAMNPPDAVSYVALEVLGRQGRPTTVGIGMSVRAMDQRIDRWGVIRECSLEDIPFLIEDGGQRRPSTFKEMKQFFGKGSGFYATMTAYQREVAHRFFGGQDAFSGVCHLLSMGKAYREIVSHSSDYHELFKALLPEPKTDLFERLIDALKGLEESTAELEHLEQRFEYLSGLLELVEGIGDLKDRHAMLEWLRLRMTCRDLDRKIARDGAAKEKREMRLAETETALARCREAQTHEEKRLADFKGVDSTGLIGKEKDLTVDLDETNVRAKEARARLKVAQKSLAATEKAVVSGRERLVSTVRKFQVDLTRRNATLPFSLTELTAALEDVARNGAPETCIAAIPVGLFRGKASAALREPEQLLAVTRHQLAEHERTAAALTADIKALEQRDEAVPALPGFKAACELLRKAMITAAPLYAGLEWQPGLKAAVIAAVEEFIGEDILATLLVAPEEYDVARETLFARHADIRLATGTEDVELPDWIRANFDITNSDPCALRCLAVEMAARRGPKVNPMGAGQVLLFRDHERRLGGRAPYLIGRLQRQQAQERLIREKRAALEGVRRQIRELQKKSKAQDKLIEALNGFRSDLDSRTDECTVLGQELRGQVQAQEHGVKEVDSCRQHVESLNDQVKRLDQRLRDLRGIIAKQGLDKLEGKIKRSQNKLDSLRRQEAELHKESGRLDNQLSGLEQRLERDGIQREDVLRQLHEQAEAIVQLHPEVTDVADYVLRDCGGRQIKTADALQREFSSCDQTVALHRGELRERLKHPEYSALYAFSYDEDENRLMDRRSRTIAELAAFQKQAIDEQREVINERTYQLFRKIIMEGLLTFLKAQVLQLNEMIKRINKLLADRQFGTSFYRFQLKEVDKYKRLLEIIKTSNPFDNKGEDELRTFFEDHKDEIFSTEINAVPDVLDYRNWYHYDMRVHMLDQDGVLMDRRTKSIGSGGEQAVPNYLLILTVSHFLFSGHGVHLKGLIFDEAFYGIDAGRRDQIMGFANDLGLQLFVASPDQDGVKQEVSYSTTLLVVKDESHDIHLYPYHWVNPEAEKQMGLLPEFQVDEEPVAFGEEL